MARFTSALSRPGRWVGGAGNRTSALPLRVRLVAILLALSLAALAITGAVAVTLLRGQLTDKVDAQLVSLAKGVGTPGGLGSPRSTSQLPATQYVAVRLDDGQTIPLAPRADDTAPIPDVSGVTPGFVTARGGAAFSEPAVEGGGEWRVVALRRQLNDGTTVTVVVAQSLNDVQDTLRDMTLVLVLVGSGVLIALAVIGGAVVRRAFRPLTEVEGVASAIADGDMSRRVPSHPTSTEVGRLSASLNAMLSQIEQAFAVREASEERMRRFVSDASHELRTPLATVRGYAELYRQGAVTEPEDVGTAMRRIETEATRMGGLVEDLLTLARVDEQRSEQRSPVDLTVIAADAVQDARALDPGRDVTLTGTHGPLRSAVVLGDESRLRQVVTNLVANALRHTPAGTPVELQVGVEGGTGVLMVCDRGHGIAPEHARQVFERFFRSDASRQRGYGGGSGLGLAIVAAIVAAHDGRVGVTETPGGGATFIVRLPLVAGADDAADVLDHADDDVPDAGDHVSRPAGEGDPGEADAHGRPAVGEVLESSGRAHLDGASPARPADVPPGHAAHEVTAR